MKKNLFLILIICSTACFAQNKPKYVIPVKDESSIYTVSVTTDNLAAPSYANAKQWALNYFKANGFTTVIDDKANGVFAGNGFLLVGEKPYRVKTTLQINCDKHGYSLALYDLLLIKGNALLTPKALVTKSETRPLYRQLDKETELAEESFQKAMGKK